LNPFIFFFVFFWKRNRVVVVLFLDNLWNFHLQFLLPFLIFNNFLFFFLFLIFSQ
jgi:hypothetical protein